jgi:carboxypeptidase PM20D1
MGNALVRTTSAVTVIHSGIKENVIPSIATALINHRIHPSDSIDSVLKTDKTIINDDDIELELNDGFAFEPHPISPFDSESFGYNVIKKGIESVFPSTIVVPGIMVASTDTKWYLNLTRAIYRFSPAFLLKSEAKLFHGHDERISIQNYEQVVNFYHHVILMSDHPHLLKDEAIMKDEL